MNAITSKNFLYAVFTIVLFCIIILFLHYLSGITVTQRALATGHCTGVSTTNISTFEGEYWSWNVIYGWADYCSTDTVVVQSSQLTGYASSSDGEISLDCATTSLGDICGSSDYRVKNDGVGNLTSFGWNDNHGWISFCGGDETTDCPGIISYQVTIDPNTGIFTGYAWNDVMGWISFNCSNHSGCGVSDYKVVTSWIATSTSGFLESSIFDTSVQQGAQLNSFLWNGSLPASTVVRMQFASSNATSGPWAYIGPDGTTGTYYTPNPDTSQKIDEGFHRNYRYVRYRLELVSNEAQTLSPRVDDIILNWSP